MPSLAPRTLPGVPSRENLGAVDWGWQRLFAYACQSVVVVVDPASLQVIQTLDHHSLPVTTLRWSPEPLRAGSDHAYQLKLASGDYGGTVHVWSVITGEVVASLADQPSNHKASATDLQWHPSEYSLLAVVYSSSSIVMWDTEMRTKVWRFDAPEPIIRAAFNPFDESQMCVSSTRGWVFFLRCPNARVSKDERRGVDAPQLERKYRVSSDSSASNKADDSSLQYVIYSPRVRNVLYIVLTRQIIAFDVAFGEAIAASSLDRAFSGFSSLFICREREELLFALHRDGSLSAWSRRKEALRGSALWFQYDMLNNSELVKQVRRGGLSLVGVTNGVLPSDELSFCCTSSDGRVWTWTYDMNTTALQLNGLLENVPGPVQSIAVCNHLPASSAAAGAGAGAGAG
eukprot:CAMPEP_0184675902 /NCGR_PEP_ID=MMETSP0308-20130426/88063_1 /TAXON_ID=38269 /ORGANISM="Gloeochaete witrockiana, Strain SAG 46.84" /LENGTH=400 /DNA_ID=CAMNT_0027123689 /DNA_START=17 /DNA_END=1215 /DNA_ORIENTATION=-